MADYVFPLPVCPSVPVQGSNQRYPVRRIFCIGRNYAAHVREMGFDPDRDPPCYFTKSPAALADSGASIPYPPATSDFHHEIELVAAIGRAGFSIGTDDALSHVFGYACGLDMTRRDLQLESRGHKGPWDIGKDFDNAAVIAPLAQPEDIGHPASGRIELRVNDEVRQQADLGQLIWSVAEIIANLSQYYRLMPGDLVYTGTPDGVGPVVAGDELVGRIDGVGGISLAITAAG